MENTKESHNSKYALKLELQQFIRNEMHVTKEDIRELLRADVDKAKVEIKKQNWAIFLLLISLLGLGNIVALYKTYSSVQSKVEARIAKEFETERIRTVIVEKAKEYTEKNAQNFIADKVDQSIKPFNNILQAKFARFDEKILSFNSYLEASKSKYEKEYASLAGEVDMLKQRNQFTKLGDQAIKGDAKSFDELLKSAEDDRLQVIAEAESGRVKTYYLTVNRLYNYQHLDHKYPDGTVKRDADISTPALVEILLKKNTTKDDWKNRALAARYLADRHENKVPEALVQSICKDPDLFVRKIAIESFSAVMNYQIVDVLECKYVKDWWDANRSSIEKNLK